MILPRVLLTCAALACLAAPVSAQTSPRGWSLDAAIGLGKGWGGGYFDRTGFAGELTIALPHVATRFVGVALGAQATLPGGDVCHFDATRMRCLDRIPPTIHVGLLGGLARTGKYDAVRAMIGPAFFGGEGNGFGALARVDGAAGFGHVALIGALQGALDVRSHETLRFGTLLFGIRLQ
jgi:hypothetical protein